MDTKAMDVVDTNNGEGEEVSGAQEQTSTGSVQEIKRKTHFRGKVVKLALGGAVVDVGLDRPGFVHLARMRTETVNRVEDVLEVGQEVDVWVLRADPNRKHIDLTMIEPLKYDWRELKKGMVITGTVARIEKFGAFVEIGAERPGLVHVSELSTEYVRNPHEVVSVGDELTVKVLSVNRQKKQIKLSVKALAEKAAPAEPVLSAQDALKDAEEDAPVPTAMEMALREAMERSRQEVKSTPKSKKAKNAANHLLEDIFSRTLESYVER